VFGDCAQVVVARDDVLSAVEARMYDRALPAGPRELLRQALAILLAEPVDVLEEFPMGGVSHARKSVTTKRRCKGHKGYKKQTTFANVAVVVVAELAGSLRGVRVLELGHIIGGPFCGHLFADHGAEVIKVEPPRTGDPMREWGGLYRGVGLYWTIIARGKRSVTIDLRRAEGQQLIRELVSGADVLVENFRSGTLERWGIGWDELHRINPRLIMVRITGYGQDGP